VSTIRIHRHQLALAVVVSVVAVRIMRNVDERRVFLARSRREDRVALTVH
jgi:hypothetical protein